MPDQIEGRVAVVGAGPTGLTLAILLAQHGHDVVVLERHAAPYALPRAVVFDSEAARGLAATGIAERFGEICETADDYTWLDADGEVLLRLPMAPVGLSGWPDGNMMTQPVLEAVLAERAAELTNVHLVRGAEVTGVQVESDGVVLTTPAGQVRRRTPSAPTGLPASCARRWARRPWSTSDSSTTGWWSTSSSTISRDGCR